MPTAQAADVLDSIRASVDVVLNADLYWFPVRHHSPAAARHLRDVILQRKPKVIFIEGPSEANDLVEHVIDRKTKPPIAIYSSYRDENNVLGLAGIASPAEDIPARFASWYPILDYSPEYVAMQTAAKIGASVVFIDLPHYALIKSAAEINIPNSDKPSAREQGKPEPAPAGSDRLLEESDFYRELALTAGFKSWNQAWDALFEFGDYNRDAEAFRRELATFCAAARQTASAERMDADGTNERERFMRRTIQATLTSEGVNESEALVVCGGFHLFMDHDDDVSPPEIPEGTKYTSVVPYSFFQVSELSGYGAGNRAPRFFQSSWELSKHDDDALLSHHVVTTLKLARREGQSVSSADAISVCQHARMLAALRNRKTPILDDIQDAIMTCCCKGDPEEEGFYLRRAMDKANIGNKIGKVTDRVGRLPLLNDFYQQMSELDFGDVVAKEKSEKVTVDRRDELGTDQSAFLHRVRFLQIPLGKLSKSGSDITSGTLFKEIWQLKWNPSVDAKLIEQNLYGDTVESAALALLEEDVSRDETHAGRTCGRLRQAMDMQLPTMIQDLYQACAHAIQDDTRFNSLSHAAHQLHLLCNVVSLSDSQRQTIYSLLVDCFQRACFSLPQSANQPPEFHSELIDGLRTMGELVLRDDDDDFDRELFIQSVGNSIDASNDSFLQGAFVGVLGELRAVTSDEIAKRVASFANEPPERMILAGAFLDGLLAVSRTSILLGADALVAAIDSLIAAAQWDDFLLMLPQMRGAFERLHERQRSSLADRVASLHGLSDSDELMEITTSVSATAAYARIDAEVAKIMERWGI